MSAAAAGNNSRKMSLPEFVAKWQKSKLRERSGSHSHFIDLCEVLGKDSPTDIDLDGGTYTFDKGAEKNTGEDGFADVWKRGYFGWEYKSKHKDLDEAYQQLLKYREALESPPLLVVCDFDNFQVHTNWTNTAPEVYEFDLEDLLKNKRTDKCKLPPQEVLLALFSNPEKLKPGETPKEVTKKAAAEFAKLAKSLRTRGVSPEETAHYVMRLLFCLFAEDIRLLNDNPFRTLIQNNRDRPDKFVARLRDLFDKMSRGGFFGADEIPYFDGGLFVDDKAHALTEDDLDILSRAARLNWAGIEPAIFGTLFERILDPEKEVLGVGAKYTSVEDIELIVNPVIMEPLRKEWEAVQKNAADLFAKANSQTKAVKARPFYKSAENLLREFLDGLSRIRIFDPACGSGNFLYVALKHLLNLEKEVNIFAWNNGLTGFLTQCHPSQLFGIESNTYAHKVASVAVWIGYLQWHQQSGMPIRDNPLMQPLENIQHMDAVIHRGQGGAAMEPDWPVVDFIIGNPPFLGSKRMRTELGDSYVDDLFLLYGDRVPHEADLVCYWFEKARDNIAKKRTERAGLLATQAIRGGASRTVLERIKESGDIFWAQSDRDWILEGANVHVSMVGFDDGTEKSRRLDDDEVLKINANLTAILDVTAAKRLKENSRISFQGPVKVGAFDIDDATAAEMLSEPNPNSRPNSDVIKPLLNASEITGRSSNRWIIDFDDLSVRDAAQYELPFEYLKKNVKPFRDKNRDRQRRTFWWRLGRSGSEFAAAKRGKARVVLTPRVSKHRVFVWMTSEVVPDSAVVAFARDDDYFFGVLHSRVHELWSRAMGTQLREVESGFRYTPVTTFETFPLPYLPNAEPQGDPKVEKIAAAARQLVKKRDMWLNPPGASAQELKKRTLTDLYNQSPTWLKDAHCELDEEVLAAYGWPTTLSDQEILTHLLKLNAERFAAEKAQKSLKFEAEQVPKKDAASVTTAPKQKVK